MDSLGTSIWLRQTSSFFKITNW